MVGTRETAIMTRRHFKLIADTLASEDPRPYNPNNEYDSGCYGEWCTVVLAFAAMLRKTNDAFDRQKFLKACGYIA